MKFNEKLIELRKKEGLSQEELGYKLNVTRQTISKWELGQTTPEMDKLVEISKIFNISVDDLINETETQTKQNPIIEEQPIEKKSSREKIIKIILVGFLIIVLVLIGIKLSVIINDKWKEAQEKIAMEQEKEQEKQEKQEAIFDTVFDIFDNINNSTENNNEIKNKIDIEKFNSSIEIYTGTKMGVHVIAVLDDIIASNKTENRKITVKYQETETQDETEIKNIKQKIGTFDNYEVTFEYDEDGYINKAIIEKI